MQETDRHIAAFEFWYNLGDGRTIQPVCDEFAVSRISVSKWKNEFNWDSRAEQRQIEVRARLNKSKVASIANRKAKMIDKLTKRLDDMKTEKDYLRKSFSSSIKILENENADQLDVKSIKDLVELSRAIDSKDSKEIEIMNMVLKLIGEDPIQNQEHIISFKFTGDLTEDDI